MKLYLSHGTEWTGTQADAKTAQGGPDYEHVEIPVDKPGLMAWLNEHWSSVATSYVPALTEPERGDTIPAGGKPGQVLDYKTHEWRDEYQPERPAKAVVQATGDLPTQIMELEGRALFDALGAALGRLNEIGGGRGWGEFAKHTAGWNKGDYNAAAERALGMLLLKGLLGEAETV